MLSCKCTAISAGVENCILLWTAKNGPKFELARSLFAKPCITEVRASMNLFYILTRMLPEIATTIALLILCLFSKFGD